jgi:pimeloyl-ACP methyl ester carboxylesterase
MPFRLSSARMRFILVHGGFHGAWCWSRVVAELRALGHEAVAIDLPGHGDRRNEDSTLEGRRGAILEVLRPGDVLVGHSGGGYDVTLAADAAPEKVGHIIYLAAGLPLEGRPLIEASGGRPAEEVQAGGKTQLMTEETGMMRFVRLNDRGRMECCNYEAVRDFFYHDCDEASARWAYSQLSPAPVEFLLEPIHLRNFWTAELARSYILCRQDRAAPASLTAGFIERLGVVPLEINSSHSPFLSMPRATAELFVEATRSRPSGTLRPG